MNGWIELDSEESKRLFNTMKDHYNNGGIRKIRINTESTGAKIKINEGIWSPELGKKVKAN
jgi:hypothetical protein